jgi:DNA replication protein DnaC
MRWPQAAPDLIAPGGRSIWRLHASLNSRKQWEADNPELAAVWGEALAEEHQRALQRERAETDAKVRADAPYHLIRLGTPEKAVHALAQAEQTEALQLARDFMASGQRWLILMGNVGVGKTVAGVSVLQDTWVRHRLSGRSARFEPIAFERAGRFSRLSAYGEDKAVFEQLCAADAVLMDDLGTEHLGPWSKSLFEEWFDRRDNTGRTVITSNMSAETFRERFGERAWDRIQSNGMGVWLGGNSMRRKAP